MHDTSLVPSGRHPSHPHRRGALSQGPRADNGAVRRSLRRAGSLALLGAILLSSGCEASAGDPSPAGHPSEAPEVSRLPEFVSEIERIGGLPAVEDAFRIIEELEQTRAIPDLI